MTNFATNSLGMFASMGHFYNVTGVDSSIPTITDMNGIVLTPGPSDAPLISVNDLSGLTFAYNERFQLNNNIWNDYLVNINGNNAAQGLFLPLCFIDRGFTLSEAQIDDMLSGILKAYQDKWLAFGLLIGFGVAILILGVGLVVYARRLKSQVEGGAGAANDGSNNALIDRGSGKGGDNEPQRINLSEKVPEESNEAADTDV